MESGAAHENAPILPAARDRASRVIAVRESTSVALRGGTAATPPRTGRIDQYELLERIGCGGMGEVYKARHVKLDKLVALKLLPAGQLGDDRSRERFEREMKAVGRLDHPNIIQASDAGECDGMPYLVMKYIEGIDLAKLAECHGQLPIPEACALVRQAALGLQHAFAHGLVHRDVKPSNIMLARTGDVSILDLGLALLQQESELPGPDTTDTPSEKPDGLTADGHCLGTLEYMAPEQLGNSHQVDVRVDVYGLGATLYKLLSGHPPRPVRVYDREGRLKSRSVPDGIPPIQTYRDNVPDALTRVLEQMLADNPDDRFAAPIEVAAALAPFAAEADLMGILLRSQATDETFTGARTEAEHPSDPLAGSEATEFGSPITSKPAHAKTPRASKRDGVERRRLQSFLRGSGRPRSAVAVRGALLAALGVGAMITTDRGDVMVSPGGYQRGHSVIQSGTSVRSEEVRPVSPAHPASVRAPLTADEARAAQDRWAAALGCEADFTNSIGMQLTLIPPGEFNLGASDEEIAEYLARARERRLDSSHTMFIVDSGPQHRVQIMQPYYLGVHEVTQAQYRAIIGTNPSQFARGQSQAAKVTDIDTDSLPVEHLTWYEAIEFCIRLSEQPDERAAGRVYRLPTNAEWEFACRAGSETTFWHGTDESSLDDYAWWSGNSGGRPHPVGKTRPNPFGLYDMAGNVWEYCSDWYGPDYYRRCARDEITHDPRGVDRGIDRILRGGSWRHDASYCRAASRLDLRPDYRNISVGLRVVCTAPTLAFPAKKP